MTDPTEPTDPAEPTETTPAPEAPPPKRRRRATGVSDDTPVTQSATTTPPAVSAEKPATKTKSKPKAKDAEADEVKIPKRATLPETVATHLKLRKTLDRRRPVFGRQAANRYYRIGRDNAWRRPRGLQSKQRRHYGYRPRIVRIGYGSPADVRGLTPSGYRPVLVHHADDLAPLDPKRDAAIIARTVGTRRRLGLEEAAKKLGIHVLNPIATPGEE